MRGQGNGEIHKAVYLGSLCRSHDRLYTSAASLGIKRRHVSGIFTFRKRLRLHRPGENQGSQKAEGAAKNRIACHLRLYCSGGKVIFMYGNSYAIKKYPPSTYPLSSLRPSRLICIHLNCLLHVTCICPYIKFQNKYLMRHVHTGCSRLDWFCLSC